MNEETRAASADLRAEPTKNEQWLRRHSDLLAVAAVAAVFVIRIAAARDRYLSPDEALHVEAASAPTLVGTYENSRFLAHPPLFFLLLHVWMLAGRSEAFLRLLPMIFGVGFLWFAHRWTGRLFGRAAGLTTLLVLAFSPAFLPLSAEVRGYSLLLFLSAIALSELEKALEEGSPARMMGFSLLLFLAILTHYAALFLVLSLFLYALIRFRSDPSSRRVIRTWAAFQAAVAVLYLFLYFNQVVRLRGSEAARAMTGWLAASYYHPESENVFGFLTRQTAALFRYFFGSWFAALLVFVLAAVGVFSLALKRRPSAILLVFPYLLGAVAGVMAVYPFGGTRHSAYILPFAAAAAGAGASALFVKRPWALAPGAILVTALFSGAPDWSTPPRSLPRMKAAIDRLGSIAPRGSLLFADHRTAAVLTYYFGGYGLRDRRPGLSYRIVRSPVWAFDSGSFGDEIERMVRVHRLSAGRRFWVIRLGSDPGVGREVSRRFPGASFPSAWTYGDISILEVWL